jgi:mRNA-degrading endonuclease RelE of RelBE toxin-antitoxin system
MRWTVNFSNKASKQTKKLNKRVLLVLRLLVQDLEVKGSVAGHQWPNYGRLKGSKNRDLRHCHLIKGNPTYVCCWKVIDKKQKIIEVYYVGTHEQAPY